MGNFFQLLAKHQLKFKSCDAALAEDNMSIEDYCDSLCSAMNEEPELPEFSLSPNDLTSCPFCNSMGVIRKCEKCLWLKKFSKACVNNLTGRIYMSEKNNFTKLISTKDELHRYASQIVDIKSFPNNDTHLLCEIQGSGFKRQNSTSNIFIGAYILGM